MNKDIERVLFTQEDLNHKMDKLAHVLNRKYRNEQPIVIPVLNGGMIFASDMLKRLNFKLTVDPIRASSYIGTGSSGKISVEQDIQTPVKGRSLIFMEDIIDTGQTLKFLSKLMKSRGAKSVAVVTMLNKTMTRVVDFQPDYYCFKAPDAFVVGYGMDYEGLYRNLPYIGVLKKYVYGNQK